MNPFVAPAEDKSPVGRAASPTATRQDMPAEPTADLTLSPLSHALSVVAPEKVAKAKKPVEEEPAPKTPPKKKAAKPAEAVAPPAPKKKAVKKAAPPAPVPTPFAEEIDV